MPISTTTAKAGPYPCNGTTTRFDFPYYFQEASDLVAYLDDWPLYVNVHFTAHGAGEAGGGWIETTQAYSSPSVITIFRRPKQTQTLDLAYGEALPSDALEEGLDRVVMMVQDVQEQLKRAPKISVSSTLSDLALPIPVAGTYLKARADGLGWENVELLETTGLTVSAFMKTVLDDADAASARATLQIPVSAPVTDASLISSGTLSDARLSANVARRDQNNNMQGKYLHNYTAPVGGLNASTTLTDDMSGWVYFCYNSSDIVLTVPNTVPVGWHIGIIRKGTGGVQISGPASPGAFASADSHTRLRALNSMGFLICVSRPGANNATVNFGGDTAP